MVQFKSEKISDTVTRIYGFAGELLYLVEGKQSAVLIDTGCGAGSLKNYVDTLTDRPYIILLTHGHVDHAMGAPEFQVPVYMNMADNMICDKNSSLEVRKGYLAMLGKLEDIKEEDFIPLRQGEYRPLNPGDIFDLGGIKLEIYGCAGHTPGSIVILLREERTLLLGDACNTFTFVFDENSAGISTYLNNLKHLKEETEGMFDKVYLSHGDGDGPKELLENVIQVCEDILAGISDEVPFEFMEFKAFIAKAMDPVTMLRKDGGIGNVVYNKEKIKL